MSQKPLRRSCVSRSLNRLPFQAGRRTVPGYDWRLSDANVADALTFVRSNWGNRAAAVSAAEVAKVRQALAVNK